MTPAPLATFQSSGPDATAGLARRLAASLGPGDVLCLDGPLGSGKTHFARALIREITSETEVPSPTYTLVQTYPGPDCEVWHSDLYRLSDPAELAELGLLDAFEDAIVLIEWPDRLDPAPASALWLRFARGAGEDEREITASGPPERWAARVRGALDARADA